MEIKITMNNNREFIIDWDEDFSSFFSYILKGQYLTITKNLTTPAIINCKYIAIFEELPL